MIALFTVHSYYIHIAEFNLVTYVRYLVIFKLECFLNAIFDRVTVFIDIRRACAADQQ